MSERGLTNRWEPWQRLIDSIGCKRDGEGGSGCCWRSQPSYTGTEQGVWLTELLDELGGEDMDRVLYATAVLKRRQSASPGSPTIYGHAPPS
ncbi:MAG: hypothetical protein ACXVUL_06685 [Solirubrobacteraceae bacterium]